MFNFMDMHSSILVSSYVDMGPRVLLWREGL